ncbi:DUF4347 domain-containing protein [[Scytonema hofmanni] UTEX B 1581]|uniref:DUF4347 domain-containing protein n=1 Tax=[Scytonema hofmanni] UTEX B 1581 TaxID=379535 RepID=UPI000A05D205|nr:DUF4347 domain-containing protein [[Scytonema hofmanni] UTEX B 1581]
MPVYNVLILCLYTFFLERNTMSSEFDPLATSSRDVLSTTSLVPVFVQDSLTTSSTGLGQSSQSLLFVDRSVADYEQLVAGVTPGTEIHVLDPLQDAVTQITNTLLGRQNIASLHIVSHGEAGGLDFSSSQLNLGNLSEYASQLQSWRNALSNDADILLYGCNVAQGELGQAFIQSISQLTGADVAASNNLTGYDGDWNLEVTIGNIESPLVFDSKVTSAYAYNLNNILTETFTGNDITNPSWIYNTTGTGTAPLLTARSTIGASTGGIPGGGFDAVGSGALRLTSAAENQASFVIYNRPINENSGLSITFDIHSYGGDGADGISFFLIDGNANPTQAGAFGGSLGYSSDGINPGLVGGYLGIGFDEFGNFSNPVYGADGPGQTPDSIAVHGSEANAYNYLVGTGTLTPGIDDDNTPGTRTSAQKKVQIDLTPAGLLSVQIDLNNDGVFSGADEIPSALQNYNVVANNGALPSTFKFGFSASTGDSTNIHEITGLNVDTFGGIAYTPLVNFTSSSASVSEGAASVNLTAQIDVATSNTVTVPVTLSGTATNGTDYTLSNSTITILPGQLTGSITLNPINNSIVGSNTVVVTLGTPTNAELSPQNNVLTATIVDNDGVTQSLPNLLWRNSGTGQNAVWQLNNFTLQSDYFLPTVTDPNWQIVSTADFNGDSIADILWRNQGSGQNVIWQMNSTGLETDYFITQVPDANWQIVGTDNFNSDGTPDILWRNRATGENVIWQMNSNFTVQSDYFIPQVPDANWQIAGTDDFNRDGTPDILWRNKQTAKEDIWQMSGFSFVQSYQLVDVIDPNWSVRPFVAA